MVGMPYSEIRKALRQHFSQLLEAKKAQILQSGPLSASEIDMVKTSHSLAVEAMDGRNTLNMIDDDAVHADRFIAMYDLPIQPRTSEYDLLLSGLRSAVRDYNKAVIDYSASMAHYDFAEQIQPRPNASADTDSPTLQALIDQYIADEKQAASWGIRTEEQARKHIELLCDLIPSDTRIGSVTAKDALRVREALQRMPKNRRKNPKTRDLSLDEIIALDHPDKLSVRSINDYLQTYSSLFARGVRLQMIERNPFDGMSLKETKKNTRTRNAFTDQQLLEIETALLTTDPNSQPTTSHKWASLIGIYSGARQGEIAQMTLTDIIDREGISFFRIKGDADERQKIKNESSERTVPIHRRLIELGFLDYVDELRSAGQRRLFPDYSYSPKHGWGRSLSRWFNEKLLVELDMKDATRVFHSLRHTMNTKLLHANILPTMVKAITGHSDDSMTTGTYFKAGFKPTQLKDAIDKFDFQPKA